jgi:hypothetical protein
MEAELKIKDEKKTDEEILTTALKRYKYSVSAFRESNEKAKEALDFRVLDQWPSGVRQAREGDPDGPRPCLVMDKLGQYCHQIINDFRQQKTGIVVTPVDSDADIKVAEVYQDIIRRIENQSSASQAYNWGFQCAVESGVGYWRVITDYEGEKSFNQEIYIKKVPDIFSVVFDPGATYTDGRDAEFVFIIEDMDRTAFEDQYGKEAVGEFSDAMGSASGWISEDKIRIAEYFYKERVEVEIGLRKDGVVEELEKGYNSTDYINVRKTKKIIVKWCKITETKILEKGLWPSKHLPIVRTVGDEHRVVNKGTFYEGMIYPAIDAQRVYNYSASQFVEIVALSPRAPWLATSGQIENYRDQWSQANKRNFSVLEYDAEDIKGTLVPPPQRLPMPGVPEGWSFVQQNMLSDVRDAVGLSQASLGASGNERTGEAILQRKTQGDASQFHFFDNASMAIEQTGRIIVDLIPFIYDTPKVMKIRGEDGMMKQIFINPEMAGAFADKINEYDEIIGRQINPKIGQYDVVLQAGPSSATKRQETTKAMVLLAQTAPELVKIGGDIMVGNMDFPGSQELAARINKTIPDNIKNPEAPVDPQIEQMKMAMQSLAQENEKLKAGHEVTLAKSQMETQADIETTKIIQENENLRTQAKIDAQKELTIITEAGRVKSSKITSVGEVKERFVTNIGNYRNTLIKQGYTPEMVDSMLGTFEDMLKGHVISEIAGENESPAEDQSEPSEEDDKPDSPEDFVDDFDQTTED